MQKNHPYLRSPPVPYPVSTLVNPAIEQPYETVKNKVQDSYANQDPVPTFICSTISTQHTTSRGFTRRYSQSGWKAGRSSQ